MATWRQIDEYRDPVKLSITDTLGKAATYLQQNYDTNVAQTQQLINQYIGTDLLRDVDKQYLGERLGNIVNYINQSGTRNWTRKNVAGEVQNYISTAIDENVLSAISSTQSYRKQQAEIAEAKKNKQWSIQNEWAATRDFQRYMTSGQVGDTYRAYTFTPYTDVTDKLLKNMDKLKEFGVEYIPAQIGGNHMFRMIGTKEVLSPETARSFLGSILDAQDMNQLSIDAQYSYKDYDDNKMSEKFNTYVDDKIKYYDDSIAAQNLLLGNASRADKEKIRQNISQLEEAKIEYGKLKSQNMSKEAKADYLYRSDFMDGWTNFLSFERVKDWKIDNSGFEVYKFNQEMQQDIAKMKMDAEQYEADYKLKQAQLEFDKSKHVSDLAIKGFKLAADGKTVVPDPKNPLYLQSMGITSTEAATPLSEEKKSNIFKKNESKYWADHFAARDIVGKEMRAIINQPGNEHLKKFYGVNQSDNDKLLNMLVNAPSKTSTAYNMLSDTAKELVDRVRMSNKIIKEIDNDLVNPMMKEIQEIGNAAHNDVDTKKALQSSAYGYGFDKNGKLTKGVDITANNGKYNNINRLIAATNMKLKQNDLTPDDEAILKRGLTNEMIKAGISTGEIKNAIKNMVYTKSSEGFFTGFGEAVLDIANRFTGGSLGVGAIMAQDLFNTFSTDKNKATFGNRFVNYLDNIRKDDNKESALERFERKVNERGTVNEDIASLGGGNIFNPKGDLGGAKISSHPSQLDANINNKLEAVKQRLIGLEGTTSNRTFNINTGDKNQEAIASQIKSQLPVGIEFQKDGIMNITNIDVKGNSATVIASVKNGKEYETQQFNIRLDQLPQSLLSNIQLEEKNQVYSASNKYAVGYTATVDIPRDEAELAEMKSRLPIEKAMNMETSPMITQSSILQQLNAVAPAELLEKNQEKIKELLDSSYQVNLIPVQGQWVARVTQNGEYFMDMPTGREYYEPRLMEQSVNKIVTEAITQRIKSTIGF